MTRGAVAFYIVLLLLGGAFAGCVEAGEDAGESVSDEEPQEEDHEGELRDILVDALNEAGSIVRDALSGEEGGADAVDVSELEDLLPERMRGFERTASDSKYHDLLGLGFSSASSTFSDDEQQIKIAISDLAPLAGLARVGVEAWLDSDIDHESDRGYERTRKFRARGKSYPSYERFEINDGYGTCKIKIWVAERFVVSIEGYGVEMGQCEEARDEISFRQVERLAAADANGE